MTSHKIIPLYSEFIWIIKLNLMSRTFFYMFLGIVVYLKISKAKKIKQKNLNKKRVPTSTYSIWWNSTVWNVALYVWIWTMAWAYYVYLKWKRKNKKWNRKWKGELDYMLKNVNRNLRKYIDILRKLKVPTRHHTSWLSFPFHKPTFFHFYHHTL